MSEEKPRRKRPIASWFMILFFVIMGVILFADWLQKNYGG